MLTSSVINFAPQYRVAHILCEAKVTLAINQRKKIIASPKIDFMLILDKNPLYIYEDKLPKSPMREPRMNMRPERILELCKAPEFGGKLKTRKIH